MALALSFEFRRRGGDPGLAGFAAWLITGLAPQTIADFGQSSGAGSDRFMPTGRRNYVEAAGYDVV